LRMNKSPDLPVLTIRRISGRCSNFREMKDQDKTNWDGRQG
jgi:hypothetical protein